MSCARFTTDNLRTAFDFVLQFCCHRVSALHFKADILLILLVSFPFSVFNRQWAAVQSVRSILVCRRVWRRPWWGVVPAYQDRLKAGAAIMIPPRQPAVISKFLREFFIGSSVRRVFRCRRMFCGPLYPSGLSRRSR